MVLRSMNVSERASCGARTAAAGAARWLAAALAATAASIARPASAQGLRPASTTGAPAGALESGRAALARGDLGGALAAYKPIAPSDPAWSEKVEDLMRFHLRKGEPLEAWRLAQLEIRMGRATPLVRDYERLASLLEGACPLAIPPGDVLRSALVDAAAYRRLSSTYGARAKAEPAPDQDSNLAPGLAPFLADIPRTKIVKGRGCRVARATFARSPEAARASELSLVLRALDLMPASESAARFALAARALGLAESLRDDAAKARVSAALPPSDSAPWASVPDAERRLLFRAYFSGGRLAELDEAARPAASRAALLILKDAKDPGAASWLAYVDLDATPARERARILERVEKLGEFPGRSWVLYQLARARREAGEAREAMTVLRRALVEGEEPLDDALEKAFVDLAAGIFSEHAFDDRLSGAMRASIPSRLWNSLLDGARLRAAFDGRAEDFARLGSAARARAKAGGSESGARSSAWRLASAVARRDFRSFDSEAGRDSREGAKGAAFVASAMTARLLDLREDDRQALAPYAKRLARALDAASRGGEPSELARALEAAAVVQAGGRAGEGERSVRKGTVRAGAVTVASEPPLPPSFKVEAPQSIPARDFLYLPADVAGRGWTLSVGAP